MKKFSFSLDKLKSFKEQNLEKEKNALGFLRSECNEMYEKLENLKLSLVRSNEEYNEKTAKGISVLEISMIKSYQKSLNDQIKFMLNQIEIQEQKIERQLLVVVEATKECSSLEKLEEKQLEEYRFNEAKSQEKFIEEYVLNSSYAKV